MSSSHLAQWAHYSIGTEERKKVSSKKKSWKSTREAEMDRIRKRGCSKYFSRNRICVWISFKRDTSKICFVRLVALIFLIIFHCLMLAKQFFLAMLEPFGCVPKEAMEYRNPLYVKSLRCGTHLSRFRDEIETCVQGEVCAEWRGESF